MNAREFCPYKGLMPYAEADRRYFFGRERETAVVSSSFYGARLTVLYGASGVGKTSLLRAAVFPELVDEGVAVVLFRNWQPGFVSVLKRETLMAVRRAAGREVELSLDEPFDAFVSAATRELHRPVFFIFDQFEEYFLYAEGETKGFDEEFARCVNRRDVQTSFLLSLREDELSKLDHFKGRIPGLLANRIRIRHLDDVSARRAITGPLQQYNEELPEGVPQMGIEDAVTEAILERARFGRRVGEESAAVTDGPDWGIETPVLQLLLSRLWKREADSGSHTLRLATFETEMGGAEHIVRTHLNDVMGTLTDDEKEVAARLFRYLVTPNGGKYAQDPAALGDWTGIEDARVRDVLRRLSSRPSPAAEQDARVLRRVPGRVERYEIFHDVLARAVREWRIDYEKEQEAEQRRLSEAATATRLLEEQRREQKELEARQALELEATRAWAETERARERASVQERINRRTRTLLRLVMLFAVLTLAGAFTAFNAGNQLRRKRDLAEGLKGKLTECTPDSTSVVPRKQLVNPPATDPSKRNSAE